MKPPSGRRMSVFTAPIFAATVSFCREQRRAASCSGLALRDQPGPLRARARTLCGMVTEKPWKCVCASPPKASRKRGRSSTSSGTYTASTPSDCVRGDEQGQRKRGRPWQLRHSAQTCVDCDHVLTQRSHVLTKLSQYTHIADDAARSVLSIMVCAGNHASQDSANVLSQSSHQHNQS